MIGFKNLNGVLNASLNDLQGVEGVSHNSAIAIRAIRAAGLRLLKQNVMDRPVLTSWQRLLDYCEAAMANEQTEHFRLIFLNKRNEVIADEVQQSAHGRSYARLPA